MINISNSTSVNKPLWRLEAPAGSARRPGPGSPGLAAVRRPAPAGTRIQGLDTVVAAGWIVLSWLAAFPGRLGDRLFAMNDTEAYWREWEIVKTRGGLGRRYRDPRFGTLADCPKCRGAGVTAAMACLPCTGTGRITRGEVS